MPSRNAKSEHFSRLHGHECECGLLATCECDSCWLRQRYQDGETIEQIAADVGLAEIEVEALMNLPDKPASADLLERTKLVSARRGGSPIVGDEL